MKIKSPSALTILIFLCFLSINSAWSSEEEDYKFAYGLYEEGAYEMAISQFERFVRNYPRSEKTDDAIYLSAKCAYELKDYPAAIRSYQSLINEHPMSPLLVEAMLGIAAARYIQGNFTEAAQAYREALSRSKSPDVSSASLYWLGECYYQLKQDERALLYYNQLIDQHPNALDYPKAIYAKGWSLYRLKRYKAALDAFDEFLKNFPNDPQAAEAQYQSGECQFALANWQNALSIYERVIAKYGKTELGAKSKFRIAECQFRLGQYEKAKRGFLRVQTEHPNSEVAAEAQYWQAESLFESQRYSEAIYEYKKLIELYPNSPLADDSQYSIGYAYLKQNEHSKAYEEFDKVLSYSDSDLKDAAYFQKGELLRKKGDFEGAIKAYANVNPTSTYAPGAAYGIGDSQLELKRYQDAVKSLQDLIRLYPASPLKPLAQYKLAFAYSDDNRPELASKTLDEFLRDDSQSDIEGITADSILFWKATLLIQTEKYKDAIQTCETLISRFPNSPLRYKAEFYLAESHYRSGEYAKARSIYSSILSKYPNQREWDDRCLYGLGWSYFSESNYRSANQSWERLVKEHLDSPLSQKAKYYSAISLVNSKDYGGAAAAFEQVAALPPDEPLAEKAHYRLGWTLYHQEKYDVAASVFENHLSKYPKSQMKPYVIFWDANCQFKMERYPKAVEVYAEAIASFSGQTNSQKLQDETESFVDFRPEAQYRIAESHYNMGKYDEAITNYQKLTEIYPQSDLVDDALYNIAISYEQKGDQSRALDAYGKLIAQKPESQLAADVQLNVGDMNYSANKYREAVAEFSKVISTYPNTPQAAKAYYQIGRSYYHLKEFDQAIEAFKDVLNRYPESEVASLAAYSIGVCLNDLSNPNRDLRRAVESLINTIAKYNPNEADSAKILLLLGGCYEELGDWQKAAETYKHLTSRYPNASEEAKLSLGNALIKSKQHKEALIHFDQILAKDKDYKTTTLVASLLFKGEAFEGLKEYSKASEAYLRVDLVYGDEFPEQGIAALCRAGANYEKTGRSKDAKRWYQKVISKYAQRADKKSSWDEYVNFAQDRLKELEKVKS